MGKQKSASRKTKNDCKKYGIAITNYVLGEDLGMTPEELYNHLRSCPQCLEELTDWQETYAVMRTEAYHKTPEAKKRYAESLEKIKAQTGAKKSIDGEWVVGSAAGKIYQVLKTNGETAYPVIRDKSGLAGFPFYEAMGWLIGEKKVQLSEDKTTIYAGLAKSGQKQAGLR